MNKSDTHTHANHVGCSYPHIFNEKSRNRQNKYLNSCIQIKYQTSYSMPSECVCACIHACMCRKCTRKGIILFIFSLFYAILQFASISSISNC